MRLIVAILMLSLATAGFGNGNAESDAQIENDKAAVNDEVQPTDTVSELEEYFKITDTTARVVDFAQNEEYDAHVIIFEPKEETAVEDETTPYVIKGEPPKPSVSFIIGHPDLSVDSKYMTIFVNAPPETLPDDLRRIYYGGRMETEPAVEPTPEYMEGLAKP
jgi:hypothetical protein